MLGEDNLISETDPPEPVLLDPDQAEPFLADAESLTLMTEGEANVFFALGLDASAPVPGRRTGLRDAAHRLSPTDGSLLAHARAVVLWHRSHRFCGRCGATTEAQEAGLMRRCTDTACGHPVFPRVDPAIIVLVTDGDRCLLGRHRDWPPGRYSTLAGFVEPGETLEQAVRREVWEESRVPVTDPVYRGSQPWPFPSALMLGFRAEAEEAVTPRCADRELADARWFTREDLLEGLDSGELLPPRQVSIAYQLLADWFDEASPVPLGEHLARLETPQPAR